MNDKPVLEVKNLHVSFSGGGGYNAAVRGIDFSVGRREIVALVGESGSGKSATAMSLLGLLPDSARREGSIVLRGTVDLARMSDAGLQRVRGQEVGTVFQEPMTALNPVYTVGTQLMTAIRAHKRLSASDAKARAIELLELVRVPEPAERLRQYPHQLSGGQRQRVMIAMAICSEPDLLIADEPTTALDVTVQAGILDLLRELRDTLGMSILIITHDMGVVADIADTVIVMKDGEFIEQAPVRQLFAEPQKDYTKLLLSAVPRLGESGSPVPNQRELDETPNLVLDRVNMVFSRGFRRPPLRAVDGVDLTVSPSEVVGLVGESGSGKSTIGRIAVGLMTPTTGTVAVGGVELGGVSKRQRRAALGGVSMIFQDPASSLNPRISIGDAVTAPLRFASERYSAAELRDRACELLEQVRLPADWVSRYPHQLSGGQRQRVGIARAIANKPSLLVADEPTSALDVSVQRSVLELLQELQSDLGFACLFITHDLSVVEQMAHRTVVLRRGRIVESGLTDQLLANPTDPYTAALVAAAPVPDPDIQALRRSIRREKLSLIANEES